MINYWGRRNDYTTIMIEIVMSYLMMIFTNYVIYEGKQWLTMIFMNKDLILETAYQEYRWKKRLYYYHN